MKVACDRAKVGRLLKRLTLLAACASAGGWSTESVAETATLTIALAGEAYEGDPAFSIVLGDSRIGSGRVTTARDTATEGRLGPDRNLAAHVEAFTFEIPNFECLLDAPLSVALTNDKWSDTQPDLDRNLFLVSATLNGLPLAPRDFTLMQSGEPVVMELYYGLLPIYSDMHSAFAQPPEGGWPRAGGTVAEAATCVPDTLDEVVTPVYSNMLHFDLTIANSAAPIPGNGGGSALVDQGVIIARQLDGTLWLFEDQTRVLRKLGFVLPPSNYEKMPQALPGGKAVQKDWLRYNDVAVIDRADGQYVIASYSFYDDAEECLAGRLATARLPAHWAARPLEGAKPVPLDWQIVFQTEPCLPFFEGNRHSFGGNQTGGRMFVDATSLYLTVGDYEFDGIEGKVPVYPQVPDNSYGRIFRFDLGDWSRTQLSMGHRNQQGITVDGTGRIWAVENDPSGGELNLIIEGANFGWPYTTLHEGGTMPVFSWVPSIVPSGIATIANLHPRWDGDLLISTLAGQSLYRLRLDGDAVVSQEQIHLGRRVRDVEVANGRIYLLFDEGQFGFLTPHEMEEYMDPATSTVAADTLASFGCTQCHSSPAAPQLSRVFGAAIASQAGITYSPALMAKEGTWTPETLRQYIADTQAFAPGSAMPAMSLGAKEIEDIIAALAELRRH
jgi:cytochrome c2